MNPYAICAAYDCECAGRIEWHHAVKQQRIRRAFKYGALRFDERGVWAPAERWAPMEVSHAFQRTLDDILGDTRNRIWLCSHHHELVTNGRLQVELPESVWEFADEFGFRAALENDEARRAA